MVAATPAKSRAGGESWANRALITACTLGGKVSGLVGASALVSWARIVSTMKSGLPSVATKS